MVFPLIGLLGRVFMFGRGAAIATRAPSALSLLGGAGMGRNLLWSALSAGGGGRFTAGGMQIIMRRGWEDGVLSDPRLEAYLAKLAAEVAADARQMVPVNTGRLRDSIRSGVARDADGPFGWVGTDLFYWHVVEFGTLSRPPTPYLRPALYRKRR